VHLVGFITKTSPLLSPWDLLLLHVTSKRRILWYDFLLDSQMCRNQKLMNINFLSGVLFNGVISPAAYCRSVPFVLYASRLSTSLFFRANGSGWRAQSAQILIVQSSWSPCYFVLRATTAGGGNPLPRLQCGRILQCASRRWSYWSGRKSICFLSLTNLISGCIQLVQYSVSDSYWLITSVTTYCAHEICLFLCNYNSMRDVCENILNTNERSWTS